MVVGKGVMTGEIFLNKFGVATGDKVYFLSSVQPYSQFAHKILASLNGPLICRTWFTILTGDLESVAHLV